MNRFHKGIDWTYDFSKMGIYSNTSETLCFRSFCSNHDHSIFSLLDDPNINEFLSRDLFELICFRTICHEHHKVVRHLKWYDMILRDRLISKAVKKFTESKIIEMEERNSTIKKDIDLFIEGWHKYFFEEYDTIVVKIPDSEFYVSAMSSVKAVFIDESIPNYNPNYFPDNYGSNVTPVRNFVYSMPCKSGNYAMVATSRTGDRYFSLYDMTSTPSQFSSSSIISDYILRFCETWGIGERNFHAMRDYGIPGDILDVVRHLVPTENKLSNCTFDFIREMSASLRMDAH